MSSPRHLCLKAAKVRLAYACAATRGLYVGRLFLDGTGHDDSDAAPDALYVARFNPYDETLLYDMRRGRFRTMAWPDWLAGHDRDGSASEPHYGLRACLSRGFPG